MTDATGVGRQRFGRLHRPSVRQVTGWILLAGWLCWAVLAWWSTPRQVGPDQFGRDVATGSVVTFERSQGWRDDRGHWSARSQPLTSAEGTIFVWSLPSGQTRYADTFTLGAADWPGPGTNLDRYAARAAAQARAPQDVTDTLGYWLTRAAELLAGAVTLIWFGLLVAGPAPVTGTRWFWFWLGLLPLGAGVLLWLLRERWVRPAAAERAPAAPAFTGTRASGLVGLCWLVAGAIVLSLLVSGLRVLLGGAVVPGS